MTLEVVSVSWLAVIVAAVVSFIVGWLWYMVLFGKVWAREMGYGKKEIKRAKEKGMAKPMILNFIGTLITAYVLVMFIDSLSLSSFGDAVMLGFWIWLGFFVATTLLGDVLWEMKSWKLFFINAFYWLVNLIVMASVIVAFR